MTIERVGEASACPGCGAAVEAERCSQCGAALRPGELTVRRVLSVSAQGRVYLAHDDAGTPWAVKELVFSMVPDAATIEAFGREARHLSQLNHPRVPRCVRHFAEGEGARQRFYLVQEFVEGEPLDRHLRSRGRLSEKEAIDVARDVLQILVYLQGLSPRIVHRDVKPANLIRRRDGRVAMVDFGAARDLASDVTHRSTLTGTLGYAPIEQFGGTVGLTSDLHALGATLLHLITGRPPENLRRGIAFDLGRIPGLSDGLRTFIGRLVAFRAEDRWKDAREALAALHAMGAPRRGPTRATWVLLAGLVASLVVLAVILKNRPMAPAETAALEELPDGTLSPEILPAREPLLDPGFPLRARREGSVGIERRLFFEQPFDISLAPLEAATGDSCYRWATYRISRMYIELAGQGYVGRIKIDATFENRHPTRPCRFPYLILMRSGAKWLPPNGGYRGRFSTESLWSVEPGSSQENRLSYLLDVRTDVLIDVQVGQFSLPLEGFRLDIDQGTLDRARFEAFK